MTDEIYRNEFDELTIDPDMPELCVFCERLKKKCRCYDIWKHGVMTGSEHERQHPAQVPPCSKCGHAETPSKKETP